MKILDRLPLLPQTMTVTFGQRHVRFHRDEVLVWISVSLRGEEDSRRVSLPFPALLDTANNCDFYLHEHHLLDWAGIRPPLLAVLGRKRINQRAVPCHEADAWIYPNTPGTYERWPGKLPFRLQLKDGIAVGPPAADQTIVPRVPVLGLPVLRSSGLDFWFDSKKAHCYLRTADWRSWIIRLLQR